jgi:hypothetical protein
LAAVAEGEIVPKEDAEAELPAALFAVTETEYLPAVRRPVTVAEVPETVTGVAATPLFLTV